jgi:hypothetical protein
LTLCFLFEYGILYSKIMFILPYQFELIKAINPIE